MMTSIPVMARQELYHDPLCQYIMTQRQIKQQLVKSMQFQLDLLGSIDKKHQSSKTTIKHLKIEKSIRQQMINLQKSDQELLAQAVAETYHQL